jgi:hypothetical protein
MGLSEVGGFLYYPSLRVKDVPRVVGEGPSAVAWKAAERNNDWRIERTNPSGMLSWRWIGRVSGTVP